VNASPLGARSAQVAVQLGDVGAADIPAERARDRRIAVEKEAGTPPIAYSGSPRRPIAGPSAASCNRVFFLAIGGAEASLSVSAASAAESAVGSACIFCRAPRREPLYAIGGVAAFFSTAHAPVSRRSCRELSPAPTSRVTATCRGYGAPTVDAFTAARHVRSSGSSWSIT